MRDLSTILWEQIMDKYKSRIEDGTFVSPMSFWLDILHDTQEPMEAREKAAANLAKYFHQSLPTLIEQTNIDIIPTFKIEFVASSFEGELHDQTDNTITGPME